MAGDVAEVTTRLYELEGELHAGRWRERPWQLEPELREAVGDPSHLPVSLAFVTMADVGELAVARSTIGVAPPRALGSGAAQDREELRGAPLRTRPRPS